MKIDDYPITWSCRFHPTEWFHEVGCPHVEWTREQLQSALETHKRNDAYHADIFRRQPTMFNEAARQIAEE